MTTINKIIEIGYENFNDQHLVNTIFFLCHRSTKYSNQIINKTTGLTQEET